MQETGDRGLTPGPRRAPGEGHGHPPQCRCLEKPVDRRAWRAAVHRVQRVGRDQRSLSHFSSDPIVFPTNCVQRTLQLPLLPSHSFPLRLQSALYTSRPQEKRPCPPLQLRAPPTWHLCWPGPRCSPIPQSANLNSPPPGAIGWMSLPTFASTGVAHGQPQPRHPASPHTQCTETHTQASQLTSKWFCKINIWRCCCCC